MNNSQAIIKAEYERLFGEGVDVFKSYYAVKFILNILSKIGVREIKDNSFYQTICSFLTGTEVSQVYDAILPSAVRQEMSESLNYRNIPELEEDGASDCLVFLGRHILRRQKMWRKLKKIFENRINEYKTILTKKNRKKSSIEERFDEMKNLFSLSDIEVEIIMVIFFAETSFVDFGDFAVNDYKQSEKICALAKVVGILDIEASELVGDKSNIGKYGLLDDDLELDRTFKSFLSGITNKPLSERFWVKYSGEVLPWEFHGKLAKEYGETLKNMIASKEDNGLSILLFGVAGSGKSSFAASLAENMGKDLYFIAQNDNDNRRMSYTPAFRYAALAVAQKQLDPTKTILVVDECDKMVENSNIGGEFLSMLGIDIAGNRDGESKGQLNSVIDQNQHTVLWICNSKQNAIDPSSRRRFDYSIFFDELSASSRKYIWDNALNFYNCQDKLSEYFIEKISHRYAVNPGGIAIAVKNAAQLCMHNTKFNFEDEVIKFLKSHCALLGITESLEDKNEVVRDYSLAGLNIRSGIKLERLVEVCKRYLMKNQTIDLNRDNPRMNLLLFGVPGSGKTEFVKYLANELDKKLCIKNASDLLDCYVGRTEQRIVSAFAEAEVNGDILFIDEGDSLLSTRDKAVRSFEVSQVNTLLTEMERFRGIFIVSTNLIQRLDQAALRRFSFRLHFDYLDNLGKELFYKNYFEHLNLGELTNQERKILHDIDKMTPSDFSNTRQQFFYLEDANLTNLEIIEALATEVISKNSGSEYKGLGNIVTKMGF